MRYSEELRGSPASLFLSVDATRPPGRALSLASWFVWARHAQVDYAFAWYVEQDVGFSGHMAGFLSSFATDTNDFVGWSSSPAQTWKHAHRATRGFHAFFARDKQLHGSEWILRLSSRYLAELQGLLAWRKVSAWSEMLLYTLADAHPCTQFNRTRDRVAAQPIEGRAARGSK
ncbi:hypothetical protein T492DRAFT_891363 [Pavlovales sp. CCMP2436]|nr:hypothetical protein T492DRAFT_891363 [Pavlovales sp. CCMP2436]